MICVNNCPQFTRPTTDDRTTTEKRAKRGVPARTMSTIPTPTTHHHTSPQHALARARRRGHFRRCLFFRARRRRAVHTPNKIPPPKATLRATMQRGILGYVSHRARRPHAGQIVHSRLTHPHASHPQFPHSGRFRLSSLYPP
jgi:hypothetical protein